MATIEKRFNKNGEVIGYRIRVYLGLDDHKKQIRVTMEIPRPDGLTAKKEEKEVQRIADAWEKEQRDEFALSRKMIVDSAKAVKKKITLEDFIDEHWLKKHVKDGKHTPDTVAFYTSMANDIKGYFRMVSPDIKLRQITKEDILDYLAFLRNTAKTKNGKPYGATTIQHHFSTLRNVLGYAVYWNI